MPLRRLVLLTALLGAACGPPEEGEEEASEAILSKFDCVLTDDLTDVCGCALNYQGATNRYVLGSTSDVDFVRLRLGKNTANVVSGAATVSFYTFTPTGEPAVDTSCTYYDSTCRAVTTADGNATDSRHCSLNLGVSVSDNTTVDMLFAVRSSGGVPRLGVPLTGGYKMGVVINGHVFFPPPAPDPGGSVDGP